MPKKLALLDASNQKAKMTLLLSNLPAIR